MLFNNSGNAKVSQMVNLFLASGFKNSATTFDALYIRFSLVYNGSKFQIFDMNIFNSIESMRFRGGAKTCRLIRNETHIVIIFRFVKMSMKNILEVFQILMDTI